MLFSRGMLVRTGAITLGATITGVVIGRLIGRAHWLLRLRLQLSRASFTLSNVHVPCGLLPDAIKKKFDTDEEGLVHCDVRITEGKVDAVEVVGNLSAGIDGRGSVLIACWTDAHTRMLLASPSLPPRLKPSVRVSRENRHGEDACPPACSQPDGLD